MNKRLAQIPRRGTEKYHRIVCPAAGKPILFVTSQRSARGTLFAKIPAFLSEPPYHSFSFEGRTFFYFFLFPRLLPTPGTTGGFVMMKAISKGSRQAVLAGSLFAEKSALYFPLFYLLKPRQGYGSSISKTRFECFSIYAACQDRVSTTKQMGIIGVCGRQDPVKPDFCQGLLQIRTKQRIRLRNLSANCKPAALFFF